MGVGVGEGVAGCGRVAGRGAVVVQLGALDAAAGGVGEGVRGEVAGEPDLDQVLGVQEAGLLLLGGAVRGRGVRGGEQTGREALDARVLVEGAAAADGVTGPVGEGGDAGSGHVLLRGLHEAGVVGDLAEVPAFPVEDDLLAVDPVLGDGQGVEGRADGQDVGLRVVAHQVEAEAVDLVLLRPGDDRVDDQAPHHGVLGGGVGAAGGGGDGAVRQQALVVAGDDAVQDGLVRLARGDGVVVDDVHHRAQPGPVEGLDHPAELDGAGRAVRVARVAALGDGVVQRVVAPVVRVLRGRGGHAGLLFLRVGGVHLEVAGGLGAVGGLLRDGADVEGRQEVDVRGPGGSQVAQVPHARRGGVGEGQVLAGVGGGAVRDGEVADVQLLDLRGGEGDGRGLAQGLPAGRGELRVGQVHDQAVDGIRGEGGGVGVGDEVADHLAGARGPDGHVVAVGLAGPGAFAAHRPDAGGVVAAHGDRAAVEFEGDLLGGGGPDGEGGAAVLEDGAEGGGGRVQVVEDAGELDAGGGEDRAVRGAGARDELAAQGLADPVAVARVDGVGAVRGEVRELLLLGGGELGLAQPQPVGAAGQGAVLGLDGAVAGGEELHGGGCGGGVPGKGVAVDPDGLGLGEVQGGGGAGGLREEVLLLAAQHPHLVAGGLQVQGPVGGQVLLVALVEDVAEAGGAGRERDLVDRAVGVGAGGQERLGPVGGVRGSGPDVQAPAVVGAVGALVVQDGLGLVLRRVGGAVGAGGLLALLQPDLAGLRHVDGAVGGDVLVAVLVDDEVADGGGAGLELHVGEGAVGVAAGEVVAGGLCL